jgi:cobyrinic acid a,c-diamide synthase
MRKKILIAGIVIAVLLSLGVYFYMYKDHRDISTEEAKFVLTVKDLQSEFVADAVGANAKYLDKTIEVSGTITGIDMASHSVVLDEKLSAVFKDSVLGDIKLQNSVKIKGRFLGYDDLLEELKLDEASFSE